MNKSEDTIWCIVGSSRCATCGTGRLTWNKLKQSANDRHKVQHPFAERKIIKCTLTRQTSNTAESLPQLSAQRHDQ
eukprot:1157933-Pelagomonas_calceolata.AAC.7